MAESKSDKKTSRRVAAISVVAVLLVLVIMFAYVVPQFTTPTVPTTSKPKEKVLVVGTTDYVWGIDPYDNRGYNAAMMSSLIYDTPIIAEWEKEGWQLKPSLATKWEAVDGKGKVWEFEFRKDVFFHDGTPFNASAAKSSLDRAKDSGKGISTDLKIQVDKIDVVDAYRIRITLKFPYAGFPSMLTYSPAGITSPTAVKTWGDQYSSQSLAATGPFKLERWVPGDEIVVVKNEKYWNKEKLPKIDKFILKFFKDPTTLRMALEKKEIDIAHRFLLTPDIAALEANPALNVYKGPEVFVRMLTVNPRPQAPAGKYLSNMLVRQAIAYAVDYDRIVKFRAGQRAYGLYSKGQTVPDVALETQKDFKYDPAKAKQLLAQAGYPNGIPEPLELIYDTGAFGAEEAEMAAILANNLQSAGIPVKLRIVDSVLRITILNSGESALSLFSATSSTPDADFLTSVNYYSAGSSAAQRFGFNRSDVDQLVFQARAELNMEKRIEIYQKMQMIADGTDLARGQIFLFRPWNYVISWKYVKGDLTPTIMQRYTIDWAKVDLDPERKT